LKNFAIGLVVGVILTLGVAHWASNRKLRFTTPFQAVLLDDNQVFYGKLSRLDAAHPILTDVYYIKSGIDPQTKEAKSVLVRRGKELHGPDKMYLNARHIVLVEPVTPNSQVAKLIEQSKNE
jgi:hypothetical protein